MRSEREMMDLIVGTARDDERIRAAVMNGSRVNPNAKRDCFQDYDIVYVVTDPASFASDPGWIDRFGERMILQMPKDDSPAASDGRSGSIVYLMQFMDGNRIDLRLVGLQQAGRIIGRDSLTRLLLDKDGIVPPLPPASDADYRVKPPTAERYAACCNEFWWVSAYVAKGLWREELPYAQAELEGPVRRMLIQMLEWLVGIETNFAVSVGKHAKYLQTYLEQSLWDRFARTYAGPDYDEIWRSLFEMGELFRTAAVRVAAHFGYEYPHGDDARVSAHLRYVRALPKDAKELYAGDSGPARAPAVGRESRRCR